MIFWDEIRKKTQTIFASDSHGVNETSKKERASKYGQQQTSQILNGFFWYSLYGIGMIILSQIFKFFLPIIQM